MERQMGRQMDKQMRPMTPLVSARMQEKGAMQEKDRIRPKTALARYRQVSAPPLSLSPPSRLRPSTPQLLKRPQQPLLV